MSTMHYSLKAKCQGCAALQSGREFTCLFDIPLVCAESASGEQTQPSPNEVKCYKPKSAADLKQAKRLMIQKFAETNA